MPLFDIFCPDCGEKKEDVWLKGGQEPPICLKCSAPMQKYHGTTKRFFFKEGWFEHIDTQPLYIKSRRQLKQECKERGLTSDYAEL